MDDYNISFNVDLTSSLDLDLLGLAHTHNDNDRICLTCINTFCGLGIIWTYNIHMKIDMKKILIAKVPAEILLLLGQDDLFSLSRNFSWYHR